jgi:hypothetical protein
LKKNAVILEAVMNHDFSDVIAYIKSKNVVEESKIPELLKQYQLYMYLRSVESFSLSMSCTEIDAIWHAHILDTEDYAQFCYKINNGKMIHHRPSTKHKCVGECSDLATMERLYKQHFGDEGFWGGSVNICW